MSRNRAKGLGALVGLLMMTASVRGHDVGETYVWLNVDDTHLSGRVELRLADVRERFELEIPKEVDPARARLQETAETVHAYIREHFTILVGGEPVPYEFTTTDLGEAPKFGHFAQYFYRTGPIDVPDTLTIRDDLLFETSRLQRSLLCIEYNRKHGQEYGEEFTATIFSPANPEREIDLTDIDGLMRARDFVWQGMLHIWIGIDHILFLVALLLPAVLVRTTAPVAPVAPDSPDATGRRWLPVDDFGSAFWNVFKIVTVFTVAHSITLSLAALDIVSIGPRFVESAIAASIIVVALNNLLPTFRETALVVIFFFGLFHGLGFASVMGELPFRMNSLVRILIGFNVGVEIGQLAIVAVVFPLLFLLRRLTLYRPAVLAGGSLVIIAFAAYWFLERAFGVSL